MRLECLWHAAIGLVLGLGAGSAAAADFRLPRGGQVTVELVNARDAFPSTLSLASPASQVAVSRCTPEPAAGLPGRPILTGRESQRGCRVTLDADTAPGIQPFPTGALLSFRLCVQTNPNASCERVWSSASSQVRRTDLSDRAFRFDWEHDPAGGGSDFDDLVVVLRIDGDRDGDGLWDDWEETGIDADGNGTIDLELAGADPDHKDVFVEADWMSCRLSGSDCGQDPDPTHDHKPPLDAIGDAVATFAAAPVGNPDGTPGIRLHVELSNAMRHQNQLRAVFEGTGPGTFAEAKAANFGSQNPRRLAYHYGIFGHSQGPEDRGSAGAAEVPGDDFLITLATWQSLLVHPDRIRLNAGSLLHELGHNLGLEHGGSDRLELKPNYLSVMNPRYQFRGIPPDGRLDYSRTALPTIDELDLSERRTLPESVMYACPDLETLCVSRPRASIDWNCNQLIETPPFVLDVNRDRFCVRPSPAVGSQLETCQDDTPQCRRDTRVGLVEFGAGGATFTKSWLADEPQEGPFERICHNAAVAPDVQMRPVGSEQPRLLVGFSDWDRLVYAFQGPRPGTGPGSEVTVQEDVDPDVNGQRPVLTIAEFRSAPRRTVPAGSSLTFVTTLANVGSQPALAVVLEQTLPAGTPFVSCAPQAACQRIGGLVRAQVGTLPPGGTFTLTVVVQVPLATPDGTRLFTKVKAREGNADPDEAVCKFGEPFSSRRSALSVLVSSACPAGTNVIQGTAGSDVLEGTAGRDCLLGGAGDDILTGGDGDDVLIGGEGRDQMDGGGGDNVLLGEGGEDILAGGFGDDLLDGGPGSDQCSGGGSPGDRFTECEQQSAYVAQDPRHANADVLRRALAKEETCVSASAPGLVGPSASRSSRGPRPPAPRI